jgi:hypothetical protein
MYGGKGKMREAHYTCITVATAAGTEDTGEERRET